MKTHSSGPLYSSGSEIKRTIKRFLGDLAIDNNGGKVGEIQLFAGLDGDSGHGLLEVLQAHASHFILTLIIPPPLPDSLACDSCSVWHIRVDGHRD